MATITPAVTRIGPNTRRVVWATMSTGDTITQHNADARAVDGTIQAVGTFGGSCAIGLTGSLDGTNFGTMDDASGSALTAKTVAFLEGIRDSATSFQPTIASGTADSVTVTIEYRLEA